MGRRGLSLGVAGSAFHRTPIALADLEVAGWLGLNTRCAPLFLYPIVAALNPQEQKTPT
jgi:hypothetical protein